MLGGEGTVSSDVSRLVHRTDSYNELKKFTGGRPPNNFRRGIRISGHNWQIQRKKFPVGLIGT